MYWILANERTDEYEVRIDGLPPLLESKDMNFGIGLLVSEELPVIDFSFPLDPEERMTDNIVSATRVGLLINKKIKDVFNKLAIKNIQFFPARLIDTNTNKIFEEYCFANIVGKFSCVDFEESELELYDDGDIQFIDKLVLNLSDDIDYGHIFRLAEFLPIVVISDELKQALEESGATGFKLYAPEDFEL